MGVGRSERDGHLQNLKQNMFHGNREAYIICEEKQQLFISLHNSSLVVLMKPEYKAI